MAEAEPQEPKEPAQSESKTSTGTGSTQDGTLLEVNPSAELEFPYPKDKEAVNKSVVLKNISQSFVAFKFKTNNIEAYRVRPPIGIVKAGDTSEVSVTLVEGHSCLPNDKIMVVSMEVENDNISPGDLSTRWLKAPKESQHVYKVRCKYGGAGPGGGGGGGGSETKPDALRRVQSELEKVHQKMSNLMLSTDSLKFQQRIMQLILILMVLFVFGLLWMLFTMAHVMQHGPGESICENYGSILATLVCS